MTVFYSSIEQTKPRQVLSRSSSTSSSSSVSFIILFWGPVEAAVMCCGKAEQSFVSSLFPSFQRAHLSHLDFLSGASSSHQTTHFSCRRCSRLVPLIRAFKRHTYLTSCSSDCSSSSHAKRDGNMCRSCL